jgi:hypothetical protein
MKRQIDCPALTGMKSIRASLLPGLLTGTVGCRTADHEADEQSDLRLHQVAWALPLHPEPESVTVFFLPGAEPHSIQE